MQADSPKGGQTLRVGILEDHQSIVDGYHYRLGNDGRIILAWTATYGSEIENLMATAPVDVLLLDVQVPTGPTNPSPYPILHVIPNLLEEYPALSILVISMRAERALIRAIMDAGASGYIFKDDIEAIKNLSSIVTSVAADGIFLSRKAHDLWTGNEEMGKTALTRRQLEALSLAASHPGWKRSRLAAEMCVTSSTVRNLLSQTFQRLEVDNLASAIAKARYLGIITPDPLQ